MNEENVIQICIDVIEKFKEEHPDFIGLKFIYAPRKTKPAAELEKYFKKVVELQQEYPDYMVGFDLVAQEDVSPSIASFAERILKLPHNISLFFHAGETNWYGSTDENLVSYCEKYFLLFSCNASIR